jgi:hypothetical protein
MDALIFYGGVTLCLGWFFYMITFRTRDFIDLVKAEEERKKARDARMGNAINAALKIGGWFKK